jgi:hypothetical protein
MTGNGKHTTYQIVNLGMVYYCFTNIICAIWFEIREYHAYSMYMCII